MVEEEFDVYIEDTEGNLILDETLKSQSNGFIDLWLPRDQERIVLTIAHDGKTVRSDFPFSKIGRHLHYNHAVDLE